MEGDYRLLNVVFMHTKSARILSIFAVNSEVLDQKRARLDDEYKCILDIPEGLIVRLESVLKLGFECEIPSKMEIKGSRGHQLSLDSYALRKKSHQLYFNLIPHPAEIHHLESYKVIYKTTATRNGNFANEIDKCLEFSWPLAQRNKTLSDIGLQASTQNLQQINDENLYTCGDVHTGVQRQHIYHGQQADMPATDSCHSQSSEGRKPSNEELGCIKDTSSLLERLRSDPAGPVSDSESSIDGCGISHPAVNGRTQLKIWVAENACNTPTPSRQVSRMLKCKPSKMDNPVTVKLTSLLHPKPEKELKVEIMSKTGEADWEKVLQITLDNGNTAIKYEVSHFCWHVAVVSEEEERENGEYHLFNDVWMHKKTRTILSLFCKDEISLNKASEVLETDYTRILPLPEELIVVIGDTVHLEYEVPTGVEIENIDDSNAQLQITHERMKNNYFTLFFRQVHQINQTPPMNPLEVMYTATVFDEDNNPTAETFTAPLDIPNFGMLNGDA